MTTSDLTLMILLLLAAASGTAVVGALVATLRETPRRVRTRQPYDSRRPLL
jgi:hypothetical protein